MAADCGKTGLLMDHKSASGKLFLLSIWAGTFSDALTSYMPGSCMHNSLKVFESPCKEAGGCCWNCSLKLQTSTCKKKKSEGREKNLKLLWKWKLYWK